MSGAGDQWGPWMDHDGKGCPVPVGTVIEIEGHCFRWGNIGRKIGTVDMAGDTDFPIDAPGWSQVHPKYGPAVIRYRIRRSRGLQILDAVLADLPAAPELEGV